MLTKDRSDHFIWVSNEPLDECPGSARRERKLVFELMPPVRSKGFQLKHATVGSTRVAASDGKLDTVFLEAYRGGDRVVGTLAWSVVLRGAQPPTLAVGDMVRFEGVTDGDRELAGEGRLDWSSKTCSSLPELVSSKDSRSASITTTPIDEPNRDDLLAHAAGAHRSPGMSDNTQFAECSGTVHRSALRSTIVTTARHRVDVAMTTERA